MLGVHGIDFLGADFVPMANVLKVVVLARLRAVTRFYLFRDRKAMDAVLEIDSFILQ